MGTPRLSRTDARRVAIRAQLLDAERPSALVPMVERLTLLQIDPTAAVAPNADLVSWSRLGAAYSPDDLTAALAARSLFELRAYVRPMSAVACYVPEVHEQHAHSSAQQWLAANAGFRADVLAAIAERGPVLSRDLPDTCQVPWGSTGWTNNRNVTQLLEMLNARGEVAIAGRQGRQRLWDLPERIYPEFDPLPAEAALDERNRRRLRSLGIARAKTPKMPGEPIEVGTAGVPVTVEGTEGEWRVDPELLESLTERPFAGRTALLSPFDRLVHDRDRARQLFDFEYFLEMYKPAAKRRWGYFALPVLHDDRLVGKLDARADRKAGTFTVNAIHQDVRFSNRIRADVDAEIAALANWLGLELRGV